MEAFVYSAFSSGAMQSVRMNGLYTHEWKVVITFLSEKQMATSSNLRARLVGIAVV